MTAARILVADDQPVNREIVIRHLQRLGFAADPVGDGLQVIDAMSRAQYDLVLMDCQMPNMDGYSATRWLRSMEKGNRRTLIVAMTADTLEEDRQRCFEAGMDDFVSKPVGEAELSAIVEKWLGSNRYTSHP